MTIDSTLPNDAPEPVWIPPPTLRSVPVLSQAKRRFAFSQHLRTCLVCRAGTGAVCELALKLLREANY